MIWSSFRATTRSFWNQWVSGSTGSLAWATMAPSSSSAVRYTISSVIFLLALSTTR